MFNKQILFANLFSRQPRHFVFARDFILFYIFFSSHFVRHFLMLILSLLSDSYPRGIMSEDIFQLLSVYRLLVLLYKQKHKY